MTLQKDSNLPFNNTARKDDLRAANETRQYPH